MKQEYYTLDSSTYTNLENKMSEKDEYDMYDYDIKYLKYDTVKITNYTKKKESKTRINSY